MHKWSMDWRGAVDSERGCMVTYFRFGVLPQTAVVHSRSTHSTTHDSILLGLIKKH